MIKEHLETLYKAPLQEYVDFLNDHYSLSLADVEPYQLKLLSVEALSKLGIYSTSPAIEIPYFNADGTRLIVNHQPFSRYRFLVPQNGSQRYYQLSNTGPQIYVPPLPVISSLVRDSTLTITEGEFKAIRANIEGIPCLALGGAYSFMTRHPLYGDRVLHPILLSLPMYINIHLVLDTDAKDDVRKMVQDAENIHASLHLVALRKVKCLALPLSTTDTKIGLDDYLNTHGKAAYDTLVYNTPEKVFYGSEPDEASYSVLSQYMHVNGIAYQPSTNIWHKTVNLNSQLSNRSLIKVINGVACIKGIPVKPLQNTKAVPDWISDKNKQVAYGAIWLPQCKSLITPSLKVNLFRGWNTVPVEGPTSIWTNFNKFFYGSDPHMLSAMHKCFALMFQHPEVVQERLLIHLSSIEGIGKSAIFETIAGIINRMPRGGQNLDEPTNHAKVLTAKNIINKTFNNIIGQCAFLVMNELGERYEFNDNMLKAAITNADMLIEPKNVDPFTRPNSMLKCATSNDRIPIHISDEARRYLVYGPDFTLGTQLKEYFKSSDSKELKEYVNSEAGMSHMLHYYLTMDLDGYDGTGSAEDSLAKAAMAKAGKSPLRLFLDDFEFEYINMALLGQAFAITNWNSRDGKNLKAELCDYNWQLYSKRRGQYMDQGLLYVKHNADENNTDKINKALMEQRVYFKDLLKERSGLWA